MLTLPCLQGFFVNLVMSRSVMISLNHLSNEFKQSIIELGHKIIFVK